MATETQEPPVEKKPSFTQQFAASRPANKQQLEAGVSTAQAAPPAAQPPAQPAAAAKPPEAAPKEPGKVDGAPAAQADPDDEILAGKRSPKSDDFRRVKTKAQEAQKERDELKAKWETSDKELAELKKAPKHNAELIKALEKERDDYKSKHDAFIVQFTPEFQQKYDTQVANTLGSLKSLMPEIEAAKLADILQLPESPYRRKMIAEATESLDAFTVAEVSAIGREVQRVNKERKDAIDKANQTLSSIAEERQKQGKEAQERLSKTFEEKFKEFTEGEKAIPVFQKRDGDENWNKAVQERERVARVIFNGQYENDADRVEAAAWAAAAPGILASYKEVVTAKEAEIAQLKAQVERLAGASPGIAGAQPSAQPGGKKMSFSERMVMNAQGNS